MVLLCIFLTFLWKKSKKWKRNKGACYCVCSRKNFKHMLIVWKKLNFWKLFLYFIFIVTRKWHIYLKVLKQMFGIFNIKVYYQFKNPRSIIKVINDFLLKYRLHTAMMILHAKLSDYFKSKTWIKLRKTTLSIWKTHFHIFVSNIQTEVLSKYYTICLWWENITFPWVYKNNQYIHV